MSQPKVLFISQQIAPYMTETHMSTLSRRLPQKIQEGGYEVRMFMPKYGCINERRNQLHEVIRLSGMNIIINDTDHPLIIKVATLQQARMQVYFIDNDDYFTRLPANVADRTTTLETESHPEDNDERTIFFVRGVMETVKKLRWDPVVIHCNGWIDALVPAYVKHVYNDDPSFRSSKVVYSLYNDAFEGTLAPAMYKKLRADGLSDRQLAALKGKEIDFKTLSRLAIDHADAITVAQEGVDPELIAYAEASGKPFLPYMGELEQTAPAMLDFYKSIL